MLLFVGSSVFAGPCGCFWFNYVDECYVIDYSVSWWSNGNCTDPCQCCGSAIVDAYWYDACTGDTGSFSYYTTIQNAVENCYGNVCGY